jgi:hypothetical protein
VSWAESQAAAVAAQHENFGSTATYTAPAPESPAVTLRVARLRLGPLEQSTRGSRDRVRISKADLTAAGITALTAGAILTEGGVSYRIANIEETADGVFVAYLDRR